MLQRILKVKGAEALTKKEQLSVNGGLGKRYCNDSVPQIAICVSDNECPAGTICCPNGNCSLPA